MCFVPAVQASKLDKLAATGRFGLGFNAGEATSQRLYFILNAIRLWCGVRVEPPNDAGRLSGLSRSYMPPKSPHALPASSSTHVANPLVLTHSKCRAFPLHYDPKFGCSSSETHSARVSLLPYRPTPLGVLSAKPSAEPIAPGDFLQTHRVG